MFRRNNLYLGIALGACLPALAILLVEFLKVELRTGMRESTIYMICIGLNALLFRQFYKKEKEDTAKGVLLVTFIYALIFFIYKL